MSKLTPTFQIGGSTTSYFRCQHAPPVAGSETTTRLGERTKLKGGQDLCCSFIRKANGQKMRINLWGWQIFSARKKRRKTRWWWFQRVVIFTPYLRKMIHFYEYFLKWVAQPPTRCLEEFCLPWKFSGEDVQPSRNSIWVQMGAFWKPSN